MAGAENQIRVDDEAGFGRRCFRCADKKEALLPRSPRVHDHRAASGRGQAVSAGQARGPRRSSQCYRCSASGERAGCVGFGSTGTRRPLRTLGRAGKEEWLNVDISFSLTEVNQLVNVAPPRWSFGIKDLAVLALPRL